MAPCTPATPQQIDALLDFMSDHIDLARGQLRGADSRIRAKGLWEDVCATLNSLGGCIKSVEQWQRVWADRKHLAKKANASRRKIRNPSDAPMLSRHEIKTLGIMGELLKEPKTEFESEDQPSHEPEENSELEPSTSMNRLGLSSSESAEEFELPIEHINTVNAQTLNSGSSLPRQRLRARRAGNDHYIIRRLLRIEEQRLAASNRTNEELSDIKGAINELCSLVSEYMTRSKTL